MGKPGFQKKLKAVAEQQDTDGEDQDKYKANGVNDGQQALDHHVSCFLNMSNVVEALLERVDGFGRRPEDRKRGNRNDGSCRVGVNVVDQA